MNSKTFQKKFRVVKEYTVTITPEESNKNVYDPAEFLCCMGLEKRNINYNAYPNMPEKGYNISIKSDIIEKVEI